MSSLSQQPLSEDEATLVLSTSCLLHPPLHPCANAMFCLRSVATLSPGDSFLFKSWSVFGLCCRALVGGVEFFLLFCCTFWVLGKCNVLSGTDFATEAKSLLSLTYVSCCHNTSVDLTFLFIIDHGKLFLEVGCNLFITKSSSGMWFVLKSFFLNCALANMIRLWK